MSRKMTQAQIHAYLAYLRKKNPAGYSELEILHQKLLAEKTEKERKEAEKLQRIAEKRERRKRMLIPVDLPDLNTNVFGMVAFRVWKYHPTTEDLGSAFIMDYHWKSTSISDEPPTGENSKGLHFISLTALNLLSGMKNYFSLGKDDVCGLAELRGDIIEHEDGVLRAEWARILYLFITSDNQNVEETYLGLYRNYPNVPVHILNPEQLAIILIKETLKHMRRY